MKDRLVWEKITRQDFSQLAGRIRFEMLDLSLQDISEDVVVCARSFTSTSPSPNLFFRNPKDVLTAADAAMYRAKDTGRNSVWSEAAAD